MEQSTSKNGINDAYILNLVAQNYTRIVKWTENEGGSKGKINVGKITFFANLVNEVKHLKEKEREYEQ